GLKNLNFTLIESWMLIGGIATHLQRAQLTPKSTFARLERIILLKPFWGTRCCCNRSLGWLPASGLTTQQVQKI
ncbi:hypothetical protein MKW92_010477, partial [Papaver armeniacum]